MEEHQMRAFASRLSGDVIKLSNDSTKNEALRLGIVKLVASSVFHKHDDMPNVVVFHVTADTPERGKDIPAPDKYPFQHMP